MFDRLVFAFYWVDSTENCGVFFSYDGESKLNADDFFVIFSMALSVDYDFVSHSVMKQMNRSVQFRWR